MVRRGFLGVLFHFFVTFSWTSNDSEQRAKKIMEPCFNEDELLNLCTDPIEICHEERGHEIKLVRLDGVKVRSLI